MSRFMKYVIFMTLILALVIYLLPKMARLIYPFPYKEAIVQNARQEGIDPALIVAVVRVESRFYPLAKSKQGARGLMQLMPDTARSVAERLGLPYDDDRLFIPDYNLRLGSRYLAQLYREFGDLPPALAAYNGGRGNVYNWLEKGTWDGSLENIYHVPFPETREFVRSVLKNYRVYRILYPEVHIGMSVSRRKNEEFTGDLSGNTTAGIGSGR